MEPITQDQLCWWLRAAAKAGDLYTVAVCQIAMSGQPRTNTWEALETEQKRELHRDYLQPDAFNWRGDKARSNIAMCEMICQVLRVAA